MLNLAEFLSMCDPNMKVAITNENGCGGAAMLAWPEHNWTAQKAIDELGCGSFHVCNVSINGDMLYIEADDFMEEPPKKYFRLKPEGEVRLKGAYFVTCKSVEKDADGKVKVIHCVYDPLSKGGESPDGRKVKGTIHWVSAAHAVDAEVRLIDNLFTLEDPAQVPEGEDWHDYLNPDSMVIKQAKVEPALANAKLEDRFQFMRQGYFCLDSEASKPGHLVFNRTVGLKDSFNPTK